MSNTETATDLTPIKDALQQMPYLPSATHRSPADASTPEDVAAILTALADFLREHGREVEAMESELHQFRRDRAALRRMLGTE